MGAPWLIKPQVRAGIQRIDAAKNGLGAGDVEKGEQISDRRDLDFGLDKPRSLDRFQLRCEYDSVFPQTVEQGFDSDAVSGQEQLPLAIVPYRQREHST